VFRVVYYADFLPNTFYLKDGADWRQGLWYARNVLDAHHWPLVIALLAICAWLGRGARPVPPFHARAVMLGIAATYGLYVIRIGGDMLYYRYAAFPVALGLCASGGLCEAALQRVRNASTREWLAPLAALVVVIAFGAGYPVQLRNHPLSAKVGGRRWHGIADANWHRRQPDLLQASSAAADAERLASYARYQEPAARDLRIDTTGWCRSAYDEFDARVVHNYGLTDPFLARIPAEFGRPGHKFVQDKADDLVKIERLTLRARGKPIDVAYWRKQRGTPKWIRHNAQALLVLERKMLNRHALGENLLLALTRVKLR